jgi:hypothetical protein
MWFSTLSQMAVLAGSISVRVRSAAAGSIQHRAFIQLAVVSDFESALGDSNQCSNG